MNRGWTRGCESPNCWKLDRYHDGLDNDCLMLQDMARTSSFAGEKVFPLRTSVSEGRIFMRFSQTRTTAQPQNMAFVEEF